MVQCTNYLASDLGLVVQAAARGRAGEVPTGHQCHHVPGPTISFVHARSGFVHSHVTLGMFIRHYAFWESL